MIKVEEQEETNNNKSDQHFGLFAKPCDGSEANDV